MGGTHSYYDGRLTRRPYTDTILRHEGEITRSECANCAPVVASCPPTARSGDLPRVQKKTARSVDPAAARSSCSQKPQRTPCRSTHVHEFTSHRSSALDRRS